MRKTEDPAHEWWIGVLLAVLCRTAQEGEARPGRATTCARRRVARLRSRLPDVQRRTAATVWRVGPFPGLAEGASIDGVRFHDLKHGRDNAPSPRVRPARRFSPAGALRSRYDPAHLRRRPSGARTGSRGRFRRVARKGSESALNHVNGVDGYWMAILGFSGAAPPGPQIGVYAGRPACFHRRTYLEFGAPKGIRILIVLVTVGDYWYSLVRRNCGESQ